MRQNKDENSGNMFLRAIIVKIVLVSTHLNTPTIFLSLSPFTLPAFPIIGTNKWSRLMSTGWQNSLQVKKIWRLLASKLKLCLYFGWFVFRLPFSWRLFSLYTQNSLPSLIALSNGRASRFKGTVRYLNYIRADPLFRLFKLTFYL